MVVINWKAIGRLARWQFGHSWPFCFLFGSNTRLPTPKSVILTNYSPVWKIMFTVNTRYVILANCSPTTDFCTMRSIINFMPPWWTSWQHWITSLILHRLVPRPVLDQELVGALPVLDDVLPRYPHLVNLDLVHCRRALRVGGEL